VTRLKGHTTLWWDELQAERRRKCKSRIKNWDRMVAKVKDKFIPKDYSDKSVQEVAIIRDIKVFR
jgi:hypothetical protein